MEVGKITQLDEGYPRVLDIRIHSEKHVDALEARIKELEANAETFARYIDGAAIEFEKLREAIEALTTKIKDVEYDAWEGRNGWDI